MLPKKKIKKFWTLYRSQFEIWGLYISPKLIKLKKKKIKQQPEIKYLKTNRYVIPLPTDASVEDKKKKNTFFIPNLGMSFHLLYKHYDDYFWLQRGFFTSSDYLNYNPGKLLNLKKFDYNIWFDIFRTLTNVYCLISEKSFLLKKSKFYYSTNKFKFYSIIYLKEMFKTYLNPNLPLWKKKSENFTPKQEGTALFLIWNLIYKQLVVENLNSKYIFSPEELKIFLTANIDPYDKTYYWPTRWLHLLDLSIHDGKYAFENQTFYRSFAQLPTSRIKHITIFDLKKKIIAQFLYWKEIFYQLILENWLIFNPDTTKNFSLKFFTTDKTYNKFLLPPTLKLLPNFIDKKLFKQKYITYTTIPIPTHFIGSKNTFFEKNFLTKDFSIRDEPYLELLEEYELKFFLQKFSFSNCSTNFNKLITIAHSIKIFNENNHSINYEDIILKSKNNNNYFKNLSPEQAIKLLISVPFQKNSLELTTLPIPKFLRDFFFLLTQVDISLEDIYDYCLNLFLTILPSFKIEKKKAEDEANILLGPVSVYKKYLIAANFYKIPSATFAFSILKNLLKNMPNKDISLRKTEPFGLNPFQVTTKHLTTDDVPFPQSVNFYTFYNVFWTKNFQQKWIFKFNKFLFLKSTAHFSLFFTLFLKKILTIFFYLFYKINFSSYFTKITRKVNFNLSKRVSLFFTTRATSLKKKLNPVSSYSLMSYFYEDLKESEPENPLDFLSFNVINLKNYSNDEILDIQDTTVNFLKKFLFLKNWETKKTHFIVNTMYKNLWLINSFKYSNSSLQITTFFWYSQLFFFNSTIYNSNILKFSTKIFELYNFSYISFTKIFFILKYFFTNFNWIFNLRLKK